MQGAWGRHAPYQGDADTTTLTVRARVSAHWLPREQAVAVTTMDAADVTRTGRLSGHRSTHLLAMRLNKRTWKTDMTHVQ